jgi:hypothetical protein
MGRASSALTAARTRSTQTTAGGAHQAALTSGRWNRGRRGKELTSGPEFARAKKSFHVQRCVGDKETKFECASHKIKDWDVL